MKKITNVLKITHFRYILTFFHFPQCSDRFLLPKINRPERNLPISKIKNQTSGCVALYLSNKAEALPVSVGRYRQAFNLCRKK
jgi:hypothetical protein